MAWILTHLSRWYLSRCCMEFFSHSLKIHLLPFYPRALDYHRTHASPDPDDNSAFVKPLRTALQLYHIPSDVVSLSCYVKTQLFESLRYTLMSFDGLILLYNVRHNDLSWKSSFYNRNLSGRGGRWGWWWRGWIGLRLWGLWGERPGSAGQVCSQCPSCQLHPDDPSSWGQAPQQAEHSG